MVALVTDHSILAAALGVVKQAHCEKTQVTKKVDIEVNIKVHIEVEVAHYCLGFEVALY